MSTSSSSTSTCEHIWCRTGRFRDRENQYGCGKCAETIWYYYEIPLPRCKHEWVSDLNHILGPNYEVKSCSKCRHQSVNLLEFLAMV